jgi:uncharacterized damage-inducible protein DinB
MTREHVSAGEVLTFPRARRQIRVRLAFSCVSLLSAVALQAQNRLSTDTKFWYETVKKDTIRAAEKMPVENYSFRPAPTVRTFGQLIGHIADDQYFFCMPVKGDTFERKIERDFSAKVDLVVKLKEAFAYCDAVYDGLTDARGVESVKTFAGDRTKLSWLSFNYAHTYEHYGNIVTYMRIKGLVPPSSEK